MLRNYLLLLVLATGVCRATTNGGSVVTLGNNYGKTLVFVSSQAVTSLAGTTVVLSSRTTTAGKTFYWQHFDAYAFMTVPSTAVAVNLGSMAIFTPVGVKLASMTFVGGQTETSRWVMDFAEPMPVSSGTVLSSSATSNTANQVMWMTNYSGYER